MFRFIFWCENVFLTKIDSILTHFCPCPAFVGENESTEQLRAMWEYNRRMWYGARLCEFCSNLSHLFLNWIRDASAWKDNFTQPSIKNKHIPCSRSLVESVMYRILLMIVEGILMYRNCLYSFWKVCQFYGSSMVFFWAFNKPAREYWSLHSATVLLW